MSSPPDTLLINGTDLRGITGLKIIGDMNLYAPGTRRGSDDVIPGRRGQLAAPGLVLDAYSFTVDVQIQGATRGQRNARLASIGTTLVGTAADGLVTLTRRLANSADTGYDTFTAQGRFVAGLSFAILNPYTGKTQLQFLNLDGAWLRTSDSTWVVP